MEENTSQTPINQPKKADDKKIMGILSYISFLCLIPLFTKKDDDFVYFHAK